MRDPSENARYLITIGCPESPGMGLDPLPRVERDIHEVKQWLSGEKQGYKDTGLIHISAKATEIRSMVGEWVTKQDRSPLDFVVVYVASHGASGEFNEHTICTIDAQRDKRHTQLFTSELVQTLLSGGPTRAQNILIILDLCYAGAGAIEALQATVAKSPGRFSGEGAGVWIIATSDANSVAMDGKFVDALLDVIQDESWFPAGGQRYCSPHSIAAALNQRWIMTGEPWRVHLIGSGVPGQDGFFRNPKHISHADGTTLEELRYWISKARGHDSPGDERTYFNGRSRALRRIKGWIASGEGDTRSLVVTGRPGSGKSAILGNIVLNELVGRPREAQVSDETLTKRGPRGLGSADEVAFVAVNAKNMKHESLASAVARQAGLESKDATELLTKLAARETPLTLVIDSLDESSEPSTIEKKILEPMTSCRMIHLVVGSRVLGGNRVPLSQFSEVIDIDSPEYFSSDEMEEYCFGRLTTMPGSFFASASLYASARKLAKRIAERSKGSYLYASLTTRQCALNEACAISGEVESGEGEIPKDVTEAFRAEMQRMPQAGAGLDLYLMAALAFAGGKGLPQKNVWMNIASVIGKREFSNTDIQKFKDRAAHLIIQETEDGETVYRLFHEAFAAYIRDETKNYVREYYEEVLNIHTCFVRGLQRVLARRGDGDIDWKSVNEPYALRSFAYHASECGELGRWMRDAGFLLSVKPQYVLPYIDRCRAEHAETIAAYQMALRWVWHGSRESAMAYLEMAARQCRSDTLLSSFKWLDYKAVWRARWAHWSGAYPGHKVFEFNEVVTALYGTVDEKHRLLAVVGMKDGGVCVCNTNDASVVMEYAPTWNAESDRFLRPVTHVLSTRVDDTTVVVAAWADGTIRVIDLAGSVISEVTLQPDDEDDAYRRQVTAFTASQERDGVYLVVAYSVPATLTKYTLPGLHEVCTKHHVVNGPIHALHTTHYLGTPVVVSAGDRPGRPKVKDGIRTRDFSRDELNLLCVWRLDDLERMHAAHMGDCRGLGREMTVSKSGDVVCSGVFSGIYIWCADFMHNLPVEYLRGSVCTHVGLYEPFDRAFLFIVKSSELISFELEKGVDGYKLQEVSRVDFKGSMCSGIIQVDDWFTLLSAEGHSLWKWNPMPIRSVPAAQFEDTITAVAGCRGGTLVGDISGRLRCFDVRGDLAWQLDTGKRVHRIHRINDTDHELFVVAICDKHREDGIIKVCDASTGQWLDGEVSVSKEVIDVKVGFFNGQQMIFAATGRYAEEPEYCVRVWKLDTFEEVEFRDSFNHRVLACSGYYHSKVLHAIGLMELSRQPHLVLAGPGGEICIRCLNNPDSSFDRGVMDQYHYLTAIDTVVMDGQVHILMGNEQGEIGLFCVDTNSVVTLPAHRSTIAVVVFIKAVDKVWCCSGGWDGELQLRTPQLDKVLSIHIGEPIHGIASQEDGSLAVATGRGVMVIDVDWARLTQESTV